MPQPPSGAPNVTAAAEAAEVSAVTEAHTALAVTAAFTAGGDRHPLQRPQPPNPLQPLQPPQPPLEPPELPSKRAPPELVMNQWRGQGVGSCRPWKPDRTMNAGCGGLWWKGLHRPQGHMTVTGAPLLRNYAFDWEDAKAQSGPTELPTCSRLTAPLTCFGFGQAGRREVINPCGLGVGF